MAIDMIARGMTATLQKTVENLTIGSGGIDLEVNTKADLPSKGAINVTYYVKEDGSIQRWNEEAQTYIEFGASSEGTVDINIIYGGNANE